MLWPVCLGRAKRAILYLNHKLDQSKKREEIFPWVFIPFSFSSLLFLSLVNGSHNRPSSTLHHHTCTRPRAAEQLTQGILAPDDTPRGVMVCGLLGCFPTKSVSFQVISAIFELSTPRAPIPYPLLPTNHNFFRQASIVNS